MDLLLVILALDTVQAGTTIERVPSRWVVRDVLPATPFAPQSEFGWGEFHPLGDTEGDGIHAFYAKGYSLDATSTSVRRDLFEEYLPARTGRILDLAYPAYSRFPFSYTGVAPYFTLLDAPDGTRAVVVDTSSSPDVPVRDWQTGQLRGYFTVPPPPQPSWPPFVFFHWIRSARDVDGDGFDDVHFEAINGASVVGLIDGRTLQTVWMHAEYPNFHTTPLNYLAQGGPFDLNGDGYLDLVQSAPLFDTNLPGAYVLAVVALSGVDGAVLWRREFPYLDDGVSVWGGDFSSDGVQDLVVVTADDWQGLSGADGSTLWAIGRSDIGAHFNPGYLAFASLSFTGLSIQPTEHGDGLGAFIPVDVLYPGVQGWRRPLVEINAASGEIVGLASIPDDLHPWSSDLLEAKSLRFSGVVMALGDTDRDGLIELAYRMYAPAYDGPVPVALPIQAAILGQRTLTLPDRAPSGGFAIGDLWVPSGAGLSFRVIASTVFDSSGGERVDGWRTHLGASALLTDTLAQPAFTGTLDAKGKSRILVDLARWPLAPGQTLTWKAVVLRAGSTSEVHTLSTLAQTEIGP